MNSDDRQRIALFGGTFDPLHIGHMALANIVYYRSPIPLSAICMVPTVHNPLKSSDSLLSFDLRCKIIDAAILGDSRFLCSRMEEQLPEPHYTIDLLEAFSIRHPEFRLVLLIGADNWLNFSRWHRYQELINGYELLIYPRRGYDVDKNTLSPGVYYLEDLPMIEISSTEIRKGIKEGQDLRHLIPTPRLFPLLKNKGASAFIE